MKYTGLMRDFEVFTASRNLVGYDAMYFMFLHGMRWSSP